ncbi:MAG: hypothetical protein KJ601_05475, partial [Nanoarchaeota archaeon]|nr:hypothetical protein [Nanoarchaeota archaeon]
YFDCYITKTGLIDFWIEGHGGDTKFLKLSDNFDCTFEAAVPVELSSEDEAEVLEDIGEVFTPMDTCEVTREFSVTLSGTEVKLTNCDQDNLYYEVIPKCARSELDDLGIFTFPVGMDQNYVLESDPIVMWNFNADQVVTYNLDSVIEESCKRGFAGVSDSEVLPDSGDVSTTALALGMIGQVGNLNTNLGSIHPKYAGQFNLVTTNLNDIQNNVPKAKEDAIERLDKMIGDLKKELVKPGADQVTINQAISQAEILKQNIQDY